MDFDLNWLQTARNELENATERLLQIDSYWKRCFPCESHGKCCIGANPAFSVPDLIALSLIEKEFTNSDKDILVENVTNNRFCPFRSKDRCLIHKERTLNCLYTPFQAVITNRNTIMYAMIKHNCEFKTVEVPIKKISYKLIEDIFIYLPNFESHRHYILLNNLNFIKQNYPEIISAIDIARNIISRYHYS